MGRIGKSFGFFLTLIMLMTCLTLLTIKPVNAQDITQGSPTSDEYPPFVDFEMANGIPLIDNFSQQANQPLSLNLTASANESPEGMEYGVLSVTYTTSWLNTPVVLYNWSGNLLSLDDWFKINNSNVNPNPNTNLRWNSHSSSPNGTEIYKTNGPPTWVDCHLVINNIPLGYQQINFVVVKAAVYGYGPFSYAEITRNKTIDLTVTTSPSSTPTVPEISLLSIIPIMISTLFVALLLRHRKNIK
jgi:hypothetical protein